MEKILSGKFRNVREDLRNLLLRNECEIISEESKSFLVEQGSIWGFSPKRAKKIISFHFLSYNSTTQVVVNSSLSADWIVLSVFSVIALSALIFTTLWIKMQLEILGFPSSIYGFLSFGIIILVTALAMTIAIDMYIYFKRDSFPEDMLKLVE